MVPVVLIVIEGIVCKMLKVLCHLSLIGSCICYWRLVCYIISKHYIVWESRLKRPGSITDYVVLDTFGKMPVADEAA
jgi:hypothetical protein